MYEEMIEDALPASLRKQDCKEEQVIERGLYDLINDLETKFNWDILKIPVHEGPCHMKFAKPDHRPHKKHKSTKVRRESAEKARVSEDSNVVPSVPGAGSSSNKMALPEINRSKQVPPPPINGSCKGPGTPVRNIEALNSLKPVNRPPRPFVPTGQGRGFTAKHEYNLEGHMNPSLAAKLHKIEHNLDQSSAELASSGESLENEEDEGSFSEEGEIKQPFTEDTEMEDPSAQKEDGEKEEQAEDISVDELTVTQSSRVSSSKNAHQSRSNPAIQSSATPPNHLSPQVDQEIKSLSPSRHSQAVHDRKSLSPSRHSSIKTNATSANRSNSQVARDTKSISSSRHSQAARDSKSISPSRHSQAVHDRKSLSPSRHSQAAHDAKPISPSRHSQAVHDAKSRSPSRQSQAAQDTKSLSPSTRPSIKASAMPANRGRSQAATKSLSPSRHSSVKTNAAGEISQHDTKSLAPSRRSVGKKSVTIPTDGGLQANDIQSLAPQRHSSMKTNFPSSRGSSIGYDTKSLSPPRPAPSRLSSIKTSPSSPNSDRDTTSAPRNPSLRSRRGLSSDARGSSNVVNSNKNGNNKCNTLLLSISGSADELQELADRMTKLGEDTGTGVKLNTIH